MYIKKTLNWVIQALLAISRKTEVHSKALLFQYKIIPHLTTVDMTSLTMFMIEKLYKWITWNNDSEKKNTSTPD